MGNWRLHITGVDAGACITQQKGADSVVCAPLAIHFTFLAADPNLGCCSSNDFTVTITT